MADLIDQPGLGDGLHPGAGHGYQLSAKIQLKVAVAQRPERAFARGRDGGSGRGLDGLCLGVGGWTGRVRLVEFCRLDWLGHAPGASASSTAGAMNSGRKARMALTTVAWSSGGMVATHLASRAWVARRAASQVARPWAVRHRASRRRSLAAGARDTRPRVTSPSTRVDMDGRRRPTYSATSDSDAPSLLPK